LYHGNAGGRIGAALGCTLAELKLSAAASLVGLT
jgi:hypothetical protein